MSKFFLTLITLVLFSCTSQKNEVIRTEVPDSALISIITEAHLADAAIYSGSFRQNKFTDNRRRIIKDILDRHRVSDSAFYRSLRQLNDHPEHFRLLYESVITRLSAGQTVP
jgi:hypothetical protein